MERVTPRKKDLSIFPRFHDYPILTTVSSLCSLYPLCDQLQRMRRGAVRLDTVFRCNSFEYIPLSPRIYGILSSGKEPTHLSFGPLKTKVFKNFAFVYWLLTVLAPKTSDRYKKKWTLLSPSRNPYLSILSSIEICQVFFTCSIYGNSFDITIHANPYAFIYRPYHMPTYTRTDKLTCLFILILTCSHLHAYPLLYLNMCS